MDMTAPISRRLSLATGLDYHLLEWGADDPSLDHTVILIHGFLDLAWGWEGVAAGLAGRFHLVAPDMRGHGDSDWIGKGGYYHFLDYLADLHEVVRAVGRGRVSLVGHSMGGSIASYYTGTFPDRIHKLALLEGMGPPDTGGDGGPERVVAWLGAWQSVRARPPRSYGSIAEAAVRLQTNDPMLDAALAERLALHGTTRTPDGRLRFKHDPLHATVGPYGFRVDLAIRFWSRITCPVLLLEGAQSTFRLAPEDAERRRAALHRVTSTRIEGAGHMMQRHQPKAIADALLGFLAA
jgi:pimeloyl-ACP methyl ester carboxylesterase